MPSPQTPASQTHHPHQPQPVNTSTLHKPTTSHHHPTTSSLYHSHTSNSTTHHYSYQIPHSLTLDYKLFENIFKNKTKIHISSVHYSSQGVRESMEDEYLSTHYSPHFLHSNSSSSSSMTNNSQYKVFGVFDGHSGVQAASFCKKELLQCITKQSTFESNLEKSITAGFLECDEKMKKLFATNNVTAGSTACIAVIHENHLIVANVGDSRCIVAQQGHTLVMSEDHKPTRVDERKRIESAGGKVLYQRVNGMLAVSRAFGDFEFKKSGVIAEPEFKQCEITKNSDFMIVACDGLYDVLTNEQIVHFCYTKLLETRDAQLTVKELVKLALGKQSQDNITVLMILFHELNR